MENSIKIYHDVSSRIDVLKAEIKAKKEEFELTIAYELEELKIQEEIQNTAKDVLKIEATAFYDETGKKTMENGVGVRVTPKLIYDAEDAVNWAKINMPFAVKEVIDKKQFETYAKGNKLDFVETNESITVVIPKQ